MLTAIRTSSALLFPLGSIIDKKKKSKKDRILSSVIAASVLEITVNVWLRNHQSMPFVPHKTSWQSFPTVLGISYLGYCQTNLFEE